MEPLNPEPPKTPLERPEWIFARLTARAADDAFHFREVRPAADGAWDESGSVVGIAREVDCRPVKELPAIAILRRKNGETAWTFRTYGD
jgi:hypothetical protein